MIDKNNIKRNIENSNYSMWALSDIWHEVDKIFEQLGSCGECEYFDGELCKEHHGFVYSDFFCADFKKINK